MGRMWQTLILSRWRALFAWLQVETLIREHQQAYYAVLREADSLGYADSVILFLLTAIREALAEIRNSTPAIPPEVSPQVRKLMAALGSDTLSSLEIMARLGLKSRVSFRQNYLKPALEANVINLSCAVSKSLPLGGNVINLSGAASKSLPLEGKVGRRLRRVGRGVHAGIRSSIGIDERGVTGTPLQSASQTASPQGEAFWVRRQVFFP